MTLTSTIHLNDALTSLEAELDSTLERAAKITHAIESLRALDAPKDAETAPAAARTGAGPSTATRPAPPTPTPAKKAKRAKKKTGGVERLPCLVDGCPKTFTRPAGRSRHLNQTHGLNPDGSSRDEPAPSLSTTEEPPPESTAAADKVLERPLPPPSASGYTCHGSGTEECGEFFMSRTQFATHRRRNNHYADDPA